MEVLLDEGKSARLTFNRRPDAKHLRRLEEYMGLAARHAHEDRHGL
jgi:hypothetical protein